MVSMKKESRVGMSLWTAILDWSCINSFSLYRSMNLGNLTFREYKRKVVKQLCFGFESDNGGGGNGSAGGGFNDGSGGDRTGSNDDGDGSSSCVSSSTDTINLSLISDDMTTTTTTTTSTMTTATTVAGTTEKDWVKAFRMNIGLNQGEHVLLPLKQRSKRKPKMLEEGNDDENLALENSGGGALEELEADEIEDEAEERQRSSIDCRLCSMCKDPDDRKHYKTTYGCAPCKSAYHPECFSLVHHEQAFNVNHEILQRFSRTLARSKVDGSEEIRRRFKPVTRVQGFKDLKGMKIPASQGWKKQKI